LVSCGRAGQGGWIGGREVNDHGEFLLHCLCLA
jgi:hypothetical protein